MGISNSLSIWRQDSLLKSTVNYCKWVTLSKPWSLSPHPQICNMRVIISAYSAGCWKNGKAQCVWCALSAPVQYYISIVIIISFGMWIISSGYDHIKPSIRKWKCLTFAAMRITIGAEQKRKGRGETSPERLSLLALGIALSGIVNKCGPNCASKDYDTYGYEGIIDSRRLSAILNWDDWKFNK